VLEQLVVISQAMHEVITDPPAGVENVTEWSKREPCWQRAAAVEIQLADSLRAELVGKGEQRDADRSARTQQKVDSGIGSQETVVGLGQTYWSKVREWGRDREFVSLDDERLLQLATDWLPRVPSDRESKRLLLLKQRFELEGMPPEDQLVPPAS
jgi:hypothetical protein